MQPIRALDDAITLIDKENRNKRSGQKNTIIGVVGASYSSVTIPLSKATLDRKLPLISYAATNRKLSSHKVEKKPNVDPLLFLFCSDVWQNCLV